jgi:hypothetical protein
MKNWNGRAFWAVVLGILLLGCAGSRGYQSRGGKGCGCAAKKGMVGY